MSIWAGIKHALNSTVGTSNFKPLDEMILFENKQLSASDTKYMTVVTGTVVAEGNTNGNTTGSPVVDICSFTPLVGGSIRVVANVSIYDGAGAEESYCTGYVYVYVNGTLVKTLSKSNYNTSGATTVTATISGDIAFKKGDTISLKLQSKTNFTNNTTYRTTLNSLTLNADVISNLIQVATK